MYFCYIGITAIFLLSSVATGGLIRPESLVYEALPGSQVRVLWIVDDVTAPLLGYSLDLNLVSSGVGSVVANEFESNFFDSRNLITAGGIERDPIFSVIISDGFGGLFLSTNTIDFSTILPTSGINDVLAELVFDISLSAEGDFVFDLGEGTALSDTDGFPVSFSQEMLTIRVVPSPASFLVAISLFHMRRRRQVASNFP